jgi:hypothetical protein
MGSRAEAGSAGARSAAFKAVASAQHHQVVARPRLSRWLTTGSSHARRDSDLEFGIRHGAFDDRANCESLRDETKVIQDTVRRATKRVRTPRWLPRRRTPFCPPARVTTRSTDAVASAAARLGRHQAPSLQPLGKFARPCHHRHERAGRRRPRGAFAFALLVGCASPSRRAVCSPEKNRAIARRVGVVASAVPGRSAISTRSS